MKHEEGFTLVEVLVAATILITGVLTAFVAMGAARKLSLVSERRTSIVQRAQQELERVKSLPYSQIALTGTSSAWSSTTTDYTYVNAPAGTCPAAPGGAAPTYQPDHNPGGSTATEALVINGCSYTLNGSTTAITAGAVSPSTPWSDGQTSGMSGTIYDFITWTSDPTCSQTQTPGSACATTNDYKRITVVVTLNGVAEPSNPVVVSGYVADPNQNSPQNLLKSPTTSCLNSLNQTISCSNTLSGKPVQYFPCDSSYSGGSCAPPSCAGHNVHATLLSVLGLAATPDLLGSGLPTGSCTNGGGVPTPPCFSLDILNGCQGLSIVPSGNSTCGSPPSDNTKTHVWVTPGIPSGTTINLNGTGSMTAYLMSGSGVAVNATVCLGLYIAPGGLLGSLTGNLLQSPIGAAVSVSVTAQAGVPTPVSFNFNVGSAAQIVGGGILGLPRIEVVLWLAASASTNVSLAYDQAQFASQLTLMTS